MSLLIMFLTLKLLLFANNSPFKAARLHKTMLRVYVVFITSFSSNISVVEVEIDTSNFDLNSLELSRCYVLCSIFYVQKTAILHQTMLGG